MRHPIPISVFLLSAKGSILFTFIFFLVSNTSTAQNLFANSIANDFPLAKNEGNFSEKRSVANENETISAYTLLVENIRFINPNQPQNAFEEKTKDNKYKKLGVEKRLVTFFPLSFTSSIYRGQQTLSDNVLNKRLINEQKKASVYHSDYYRYKSNHHVSAVNNYAFNLQVNGYLQSNVKLKGSNTGMVLNPSSKNFIELNSTVSVLSGSIHQQQYLPYFPAGKCVTELKLEKDNIEQLSHPFVSILIRNYFSQRQQPTLSDIPDRGYTLFDISMGSEVRIQNQKLHMGVFCTNIFSTAYFNHLAIKRGLGVYDHGRNIGVLMQVDLGR